MEDFLDIDPIARERSRARRLVVGPRGEDGICSVYAVVHYRSPDLAALPGVDVTRVRVDVGRALDLRHRLEACETEEQRAAALADFEALKRQAEESLADEVVGTEDKARAYLERCRRILCAAIQAIGIAREGVEPGPKPAGTRPEDLCRPLTRGKDPVLLRSVTLAPDRTDPNALSVLNYDARETMTLALFIAAAFSTQSLVEVLPTGARDAGVGGPDRDPVRVPTERDPARPQPGGGSARRSGRSAGKGGRRGRGQ